MITLDLARLTPKEIEMFVHPQIFIIIIIIVFEYKETLSKPNMNAHIGFFQVPVNQFIKSAAHYYLSHCGRCDITTCYLRLQGFSSWTLINPPLAWCCTDLQLSVLSAPPQTNSTLQEQEVSRVLHRVLARA